MAPRLLENLKSDPMAIEETIHAHHGSGGAKCPRALLDRTA